MSNFIQPKIIGWDIGGAHLKAVLLDTNGAQLSCIQLPCPLWRGLNELEVAIEAVFSLMDVRPDEALHALTMTGELVDLFPNRHTGVCEIAKYVMDLLGRNTFFYAANNGFVKFENVAEYTAQIASTNWHASARLLAEHVQDALLIDIGSTTSDIIPIAHAKVALQDLSDASRMQHDTLVYTGVVRTPIMAVAQKITINDNGLIVEMNVAAEFFATMADVYRLTGELSVENDMAETADSKGKTKQESARRLARMVGCDLEDKPIETWIKLAFSFRAIQLKQLKAAILKHLKPNMPIIGAGAGSFLVKVLATELGCEYRSLTDILKSDISSNDMLNVLQQTDLEVCFPAYAVARLALVNQLLKAISA
ncbi:MULTISPECIES: hydantoinase/oxoprolinase family protein [Methylotenera]|uniref:hydantoinase/oxoprolinase family protein n=1 Tax=Methylotenera TaxID=359407 RepID=UPI000369B55E|nr:MULTISPECIES: hydantoinase/oxoprolinase family protein [Methylotenera]